MLSPHMMTSFDTKSSGKNNARVSSSLSKKICTWIESKAYSTLFLNVSFKCRAHLWFSPPPYLTPNSPRCSTNLPFSPRDETDNHPVRHHHRPSEQGRHVQPVLLGMSRQLRQRTDLFSSCEMDAPFRRPTGHLLLDFPPKCR